MGAFSEFIINHRPCESSVRGRLCRKAIRRNVLSKPLNAADGVSASIEQSNDANGFWLPASIAPFTVVVTVTNVGDFALRAAGEKLAVELGSAELDVLLDDRDERAGVKFKDADLVGIPYRINVGKKAASGLVELVTRSTSTSVDVALGDVVALVKKRMEVERLLEASL